MCNQEAASPLPHNSPSHQGYISPRSPSALLGWCCVVCIVSAPLKQTLPPHAQEWAGIPTSSPCPTVRPQPRVKGMLLLARCSVLGRHI